MLDKPVMHIVFELTKTPEGVEAFTWMSPDFKMLAPDAKNKTVTTYNTDTHSFRVYHPRYATPAIIKAVAEYASKIIIEQSAKNAKRKIANR